MARNVTDASQITELARDLRLADKAIKTNLRKRLRTAAKPIQLQVQADYRALPSSIKGAARDAKTGRYTQRSGRKGTGLRASLAKATSTTVSITRNAITLKVLVKGSKMPEDMQGLPAVVEGKKRWRHPLFGDTDHWYGQRSMPVIEKAAAKHMPQVQASVNRAIEDTVAALEKGNL